MMSQSVNSKPRKRGRGFSAIASLVDREVSTASRKRGFAETRLLTHWSEIVGADTAAVARPVEIKWGKGGIGATLTMLTTGAHAPVLQASLPGILERVNSCFGYAAISRIRITQTSATGFEDGKVAFHTKAEKATPQPAPECERQSREMTSEIADSNLKNALARLGAQVLSRTRQRHAKDKPNGS